MNEDIRILKIESCTSLSKRSTLTYQIGCKENDIYIRLLENSEKGLFSKEWIRLKKIIISNDSKFASSSLHETFKGKSINSAGFMMAVLKHEGLVKNSEEKTRSYIGCDATDFNTYIKKLIDSDVSLGDNQPLTPSVKTSKKAHRRP